MESPRCKKWFQQDGAFHRPPIDLPANGLFSNRSDLELAVAGVGQCQTPPTVLQGPVIVTKNNSSAHNEMEVLCQRKAEKCHSHLKNRLHHFFVAIKSRKSSCHLQLFLFRKARKINVKFCPFINDKCYFNLNKLTLFSTGKN